MQQPSQQESFGFAEETVPFQEEKPETSVNPVPEPVPEVEDQSQKSSVSTDSAKLEIISPITVEPDVAEPEPEQGLTVETVAPEPPVEEETPIDISAVQIPPVVSSARVAPWATPQKKDDSKKSLTLTQIQELETRRAAEQARRIAAERQAAQQQQIPVVVSPQSQQR